LVKFPIDSGMGPLKLLLFKYLFYLNIQKKKNNDKLFLFNIKFIILIILKLLYYEIKIFTKTIKMVNFQWIQELVHLKYYYLNIYFY